MNTKTYVFALDLIEDENLIREYEDIHKEIWPEIRQSILDAGIVDMQIYRFGNRLCMLMETDSSFSFEKKEKMDAENPTVQKWEEQMWKYQQAIPGSKPGSKWVLMEKIFQL